MRRLSWRSVAMMRRPPCGLDLLVQALPLVVQLLRARRACRLRTALASASRNWIWFSTLPPSTMSVPRPAMLVAMVITPGRPAWATISASLACCLALSTWCGSLALFSRPEISSEFSIEVVPTSTGWPRSWQSRMSSITASNFSLAGLVDQVELVLADGRLVGRDHHRLQAVDLLELVGLGVGRAGHARRACRTCGSSSGR